MAPYSCEIGRVAEESEEFLEFVIAAVDVADNVEGAVVIAAISAEWAAGRSFVSKKMVSPAGFEPATY